MPLPTDEKLLALSQDLLKQFDTLFGLHPGFRAAHARGTMLSGTFTPDPEAVSLSRAPHVTRASTPVTARFSSSTGIPLLPDNDPKSWTEKDSKGEPRDPWVAQWFLPLIAVATGDVVTFVTGSKGGVAAVSNLCRAYGRRHRDGLLPIVALRIHSYKHKQYGRIETPDLPIVGWEGAPTVMPAQAAADDLNDEIPF